MTSNMKTIYTWLGTGHVAKETTKLIKKGGVLRTSATKLLKTKTILQIQMNFKVNLLTSYEEKLKNIDKEICKYL